MQEFLDHKNEVGAFNSNMKDEIQQKFETINNRVNTMENSIKTILSFKVSESIMKVKDSVIDAVQDDNLKMQKEVEIWKRNFQKINCV